MKSTGPRQRLKQKELGFSLHENASVTLPPYNALLDSNLRTYFDRKQVRKVLQAANTIDEAGWILNLDKNSGKLHIIDQEFEFQAQEEERQRKEDMLARRSVSICKQQAMQQEFEFQAQEEERQRKEDMLARRSVSICKQQAMQQVRHTLYASDGAKEKGRGHAGAESSAA
eukprot:NODE_5230_length_682_cov_23.736937_g5067_i0.p1 GENE.NODE_5230_length_682_cov_23.736937_g5067_i0~~NODE_5230_length_682_cov_23.736937_g5067_i0.p1  ORF type:complete len:171 (-),score=54.49 NODE_5230_length_682_cov_23.736937_g5067_i0:83-595(-)